MNVSTISIIEKPLNILQGSSSFVSQQSNNVLSNLAAKFSNLKESGNFKKHDDDLTNTHSAKPSQTQFYHNSKVISDGEQLKKRAIPSPWTVGIKYRDGSTFHTYCSGALISEKHVLTAANCVHLLKSEGVYVGVGDFNRRASGNDIGEVLSAVVAIHVHPKFSIITYRNNVAILELARKIEFDSRKYPAMLIPKHFYSKLYYDENHVNTASDDSGDKKGDATTAAIPSVVSGWGSFNKAKRFADAIGLRRFMEGYDDLIHIPESPLSVLDKLSAASAVGIQQNYHVMNLLENSNENELIERIRTNMNRSRPNKVEKDISDDADQSLRNRLHSQMTRKEGASELKFLLSQVPVRIISSSKCQSMYQTYGNNNDHVTVDYHESGQAVNPFVDLSHPMSTATLSSLKQLNFGVKDRVGYGKSRKRFIYPGMICADNQNVKDGSCSGDSGSPLTFLTPTSRVMEMITKSSKLLPTMFKNVKFGMKKNSTRSHSDMKSEVETENDETSTATDEKIEPRQFVEALGAIAGGVASGFVQGAVSSAIAGQSQINNQIANHLTSQAETAGHQVVELVQNGIANSVLPVLAGIASWPNSQCTSNPNYEPNHQGNLFYRVISDKLGGSLSKLTPFSMSSTSTNRNRVILPAVYTDLRFYRKWIHGVIGGEPDHVYHVLSI